MTSKRIDYIDLAKGVCIILVVLLHSGVSFDGKYEFLNDYLRIFRMPLYFFLSGLFFKTYDSLSTFLKKKINNLIIPFIFFNCLYCPIASLCTGYSSHFNNSYMLIYDSIIAPINYPLWFLRSLFIAYIFYYGMCRYIPDLKIRIIGCFTVSVLVWFLNPIIKETPNTLIHIILYSNNILTAIFVLPFFAVAEILRKQGFLAFDISLKRKIVYILAFGLLWILFTTPNVDLYQENYSENIIKFYISSFSAVLMILLLASIFKKIPYISYMGRYSLIVLGTHVLFITTIKYIFPNSSPWVSAGTTLVLAPACIYLLKKYCPYVTAQKNLFDLIGLYKMKMRLKRIS